MVLCVLLCVADDVNLLQEKHLCCSCLAAFSWPAVRLHLSPSLHPPIPAPPLPSLPVPLVICPEPTLLWSASGFCGAGQRPRWAFR